MKIVAVDGDGLIGSKTVAILRSGGNEVVAAFPKDGVNTYTGEGLKEPIAGANAPSFEAKAVLEFFETSGTISRYPSLGPTGFPVKATTTPSSPKRNW